MADATATGHAHGEPTAAPPARIFLRIGLIMAGWTALHLALVAALLHPLTPGGWWTYLAIFGFLGFAIVKLLGAILDRAYPGKWHRLLVMRPFWYAQILLLPASLAGASAWLVGWPFRKAVGFGQAAAVAALGAMLLVAVVGYFGSRRLVLRRLEFAFPDLPRAFDGVTIAQLSDLHVGPHTSASFLARIVREVAKAKPDLIAYTGDQVDDFDRDVARFAEVFGPLRAPLGAFAIAGNHDVYAGWPGVRAGMQAAGMRVLVNEATAIERGGERVWILGTGDPAGLQTLGPKQLDVAPDVPRALAEIPPDTFTIALAHNPALWPQLAERGVHLTLSGHTHHGQLSIPFLKWSLASPFLDLAMGTYERGRSKLYINPGTNHWALPLRIGAWPEITLVTLRRSASAMA